VVLRGEAADESLALQMLPDTLAEVTPEQAQVAVINAVDGADVSVSLAGDQTALASELAAGSNAAIGIAPVRGALTVQVAGDEGDPVEVSVPAMPLVGGVYYTVLVYDG